MEVRDWVLRYQLTPEEVAAAMVDHLPGVRNRIRQARRTLLIILVLVAALAAATAGDSLLGALVPIVVIAAVLPFTMRRNQMIKAHLKQVQATPSYTAPVEVSVAGEGLRVRTSMTDCWHAWTYWDAVEDATDGVALVLRGGWGIQFIPARAFAPGGQQTAWATYVRGEVERQPAPS